MHAYGTAAPSEGLHLSGSVAKAFDDSGEGHVAANRGRSQRSRIETMVYCSGKRERTALLLLSIRATRSSHSG